MNAPSTLAIAGAGPAGLTAATLLALAGRTVVVHEKNAIVSTRFVWDLQVIEDASDRQENVPAMFARLGLPAPAWVPATAAEFFDAKMRRFEIASKEPYAWFVTRGPGEGTPDTTLAGALEAGVEVRFRSRLEPLFRESRGIGLQTPDGLARETAFETDGTTRVRVLYDPSVAPGGYAYLFTVGGRGTFGCAIVRDLGGIDRYFEKAKEKLLSVDAIPMEECRDAYSFMNFARSRACRDGRPRRGRRGRSRTTSSASGCATRSPPAPSPPMHCCRGATSPRSHGRGSGGGSACRSSTVFSTKRGAPSGFPSSRVSPRGWTFARSSPRSTGPILSAPRWHRSWRRSGGIAR